MKKKVLYITEYLYHYRAPLFSMLGDELDITIGHQGAHSKNVNYKEINLAFQRIGPFLYINRLPDLSDFDVVILTFNIRIISFYRLFLQKNRKFRLLLYGIGVSASYKNSYDVNKKLDWIRKFWISRSDGALFYEFYPLVKYSSMGIPHSKLYVAYNTVINSEKFDFDLKTYEAFIFLGALYKQKKIYDLLEAYKQAWLDSERQFPKLEIIGDGEEHDNIVRWIEANDLGSQVILHGTINQVELLIPIMNRAIACVSPGQAGLSVQNCFSFGLPFITTKYAITGGELFSIIDRINGFFYDGSLIGLKNLLTEISKNDILIRTVSRNAYEFYHRFRTPAIWIEAFKNAING